MTTILLIEDNQDFRQDVCELLQLEDYQPIPAENGFVGLQMLRKHVPNLIICDIEMPIINGLQLLSIVKANPLWAMIPFVLLTTRGYRQSQQNLRDSGSQALMTKPIKADDLLSVIAQILNQNSASV